MKSTNFLLVGVGGQGTLLASGVLSAVGVRAGFDVKKAEVHGMAQRGGSVSSHIRWGEKIYSPLIGKGEADFMIALEKLEALRYVDMLRAGAVSLIGDMRVPPLTVSSGGNAYPGDDEIRRGLSAVGDVRFVQSLRLAEEAGNVRAHNMVMLGALSTFMPEIAPELWLSVIEELVPARSIDVNRQAFQLGSQSC
ncbi:MAG: indolepyruvate oxidoreductase subunit beta [Anaerolineae bacterium]|nr:indolepyruvate oxidoreductase subunit beta [Anaerolineae bacterium]